LETACYEGMKIGVIPDRGVLKTEDDTGVKIKTGERRKQGGRSDPF